MTSTVYTITPPDIWIPNHGPSILMLGIPFDESEPYIDVFDKLFPDRDVTFFTSESGIDEDNLAWYRATLSLVNTIIIDIDNITPEELLLALHAEDKDDQVVFWVSPAQHNPKLHKLLTSFQRSLFSNIDELKMYIEAAYGDDKG